MKVLGAFVGLVVGGLTKAGLGGVSVNAGLGVGLLPSILGRSVPTGRPYPAPELELGFAVGDLTPVGLGGVEVGGLTKAGLGGVSVNAGLGVGLLPNILGRSVPTGRPYPAPELDLGFAVFPLFPPIGLPYPAPGLDLGFAVGDLTPVGRGGVSVFIPPWGLRLPFLPFLMSSTRGVYKPNTGP